MAKTDPRVDAYIAGKAPFAGPVLTAIRDAVRRACPEVEETIRWSMPSFTYKGKILCQMAAFKTHAAFGFWRGGEVAGVESSPIGSFRDLKSADDLPPPARLDAMIRKAAALIETGAAGPRRTPKPKRPIAMPGDLAGALAVNSAAQGTYDRFPPGQQREYLEWITEAKRADTRAARIAQAIEWMAEGKRRNWKYEKG